MFNEIYEKTSRPTDFLTQFLEKIDNFELKMSVLLKIMRIFARAVGVYSTQTY